MGKEEHIGLVANDELLALYEDAIKNSIADSWNKQHHANAGLYGDLSRTR